MGTIAARIIVVGLVQGVGFRPFVHRLASRLGLRGYVVNTGGSEVEIWVEGPDKKVSKFIELLEEEKPPPAIIEEKRVEIHEPAGYTSFNIMPSRRKLIRRSNIPPDFAICSDCLREILDPGNRRYRYAFNSCAWCGPRYSMMYDIPYDRVNTSMKKYRLCPECLKEYSDLGNTRRYHAQGISCPEDGPRLKLYDNKWNEVRAQDPIREAAKILDEGYIVAIKGLGGYHLAALASDDDIVRRLRERKKRPHKPFAVMVLDTVIAEKLVYLDEEARRLLESPQAPILLLPKRKDTPISKLVSPGMAYEGVFRAYTGLHYLFLMETRDRFAIMTSGNIHGEPMCRDEECVKEKLSGIADYFLVHDREIVHRVDDSVMRFTDGEPVFIRRSRGYAPLWIRIKRSLSSEIIGFGADLSNAAAIGFEDKIVLTPYIGDMDHPRAQEDLLYEIGFLRRAYRVERPVIAYDKHPGYLSSGLAKRYAEEEDLDAIPVQHHYAHVLGAAYDVGLEGIIVGIAIDGTGYGDDGGIWGGEIIVFDTRSPWYERAGHLKPHRITGERDVVYPARYLYSILLDIYGVEANTIVKRLGLEDLVPGGLKEYKAVSRLIEMGHSIFTTSTGRFLDAVSSLLRICWERTYEGEPAIMLENSSVPPPIKDVSAEIISDDGKIIIDTDPIIESAIDLLYNHSYSRGRIAYTVQYVLGHALGEAAMIICEKYGCDGIVVSGGAGVNSLIVRGIRSAADRVFLPRKIPLGDGGIAFGQVIAADLIVSSKKLLQRD